MVDIDTKYKIITLFKLLNIILQLLYLVLIQSALFFMIKFTNILFWTKAITYIINIMIEVLFLL